MSGLLFLTSDDFHLQQGARGPIMCSKIRGFSLILFYSTLCKYCKDLIPIFKQLPGSIGGCQFGMLNVSHNRVCIQMSQQTIAPIREVPYIILFVDGKPFMRYKGPHDMREIIRFVMEVAQKVKSKTNFDKNDKRIQKNTKSGIPDYTIGHPLCGQDQKVCYLDYNEAYDKENK
mgnify:CR=1 FL=1